MVLSVAPLFRLTELLVFTEALYTPFFVDIFLVGGMCFDPTIALSGGVCGTVDGFDFFVVLFFFRHVAYATVADFNIVSVEDF